MRQDRVRLAISVPSSTIFLQPPAKHPLSPLPESSRWPTTIYFSELLFTVHNMWRPTQTKSRSNNIKETSLRSARSASKTRRGKNIQQPETDSFLTDSSADECHDVNALDGEHTDDEAAPWALPKNTKTFGEVSGRQDKRLPLHSFSDASLEERSSLRAAVLAKQSKQEVQKAQKTSFKTGRRLTELLPSSETQVFILNLFNLVKTYWCIYSGLSRWIWSYRSVSAD